MKRKTSSGRIGAVLLACGALVILLAIVFFSWKNSSVTTVTQPQITASPMQTYVNTKYGYQISYPSTLAVREYGTGAGFRPTSKPSDPQYEVINIDARYKNGNAADVPFATYVQTAASGEIQNYGKLVSLSKITTTSGLIGYETTWQVAPMTVLSDDGKVVGGGKSSVSLPITYFDLPGVKPASTVQVSLGDSAYMSQYEQMLPTFNLVK